MKVLFYNVWWGCKERYEKLVSFVKNRKLDVLGMAELNGWDEDQCSDFCNKTGLEHFELCKTENGGFHTGLFARKPIEVVENRDDILDKGFLKVRVNGVSFIVVHLHPWSEDERLKEAREVVNRLDETTIVMGDFNSLSPEDGYDKESILERQEELEMDKFGEGGIRTDVVQEFLNAGLCDTNPGGCSTVPTPYNKDDAHFENLRLDYILCTRNLHVELKEASVVKNEQTDWISDHYPVESVFDH